ncbi:MAG: peroxidase family protein, partial [Pirellulales bacterium]
MTQHRTKKQRLQFEQLEERQFLDAGGMLPPGPGDPDQPVEYRTIDGSDNNLTIDSQGAADTNVIRFGYPAVFPDGHGDQIDPAGRPNARDISNRINVQSESVVNDRYLTDWIVQWGQFLTHDMDLTGTNAANNVLSDGSVGDFSIAINDPQDPLGPNPIPFNRSNFDPTTGTPDLLPTPFPPFQRPNWREQINEVTSYIDASNVYGSDDSRAAALRTFEDGKLITTANGALPGYNTPGEENDDPFGLGADLFLAGDVRANEQVGLTAVHALFVREHNRLADLLKAYDSSLTDEQIYQTARKIVGAEMQIITYKEFLPALMGDAAPQASDYQYDDSLNASITNSFAAAIFRYGHSMQSSELLLVNNNGNEVDSLTLRDAFFDPDLLGDNPENVDLLMKGLASQLAQENDLLLIDDIRNFLFGPPGAGGSDLAALDIQRGRDHGLPDYNALRFFYGLQPVASFDEISSDPAIQAALEELYGTVGNIDAFIGVLAEDHLPGSSLGELTSQIINNQFTRLRDGDRFFYTDDPGLQTHAVEAVIDLDKVTLANIIRDNTKINKI